MSTNKNLVFSYWKAENQRIHHPDFELNNCEVFIKREDLSHKYISGNKFRKLKYNALHAQEIGAEQLLTFGGAYSNHIVATAYATRELGLESVGIIRGEELADRPLNPSLTLAVAQGMHLEFVDRETYRRKEEKSFLKELQEKYPKAFILPEGGNNALAVKGCADILSDEDASFDYIVTAVGTGGTLAGVLKSAQAHHKVIGFSVLKGAFQSETVKKHNPDKAFGLSDAYCFGGYAKVTEELITFINDFKKATQIPLDPVYTGKMMYAIKEGIKNGFFPKGSRILAIHTGGLQGIAGMNKQLKKKNKVLIK